MRRNVTVGFDGSSQSERAAVWAAEDAARRGRPLRLLYAVGGRGGTGPREAEAALTAAERIVHARWPAVEVAAEWLPGDAATVLREAEADALEIVVGHRGRGGFARLPMGSVGLRLILHARVPVVVVGACDHEARDVVVGVDLKEDPGPVLEYAFGAASARGGRLRVVHAWRPPLGVADYGDVMAGGGVAQHLEKELDGACAPWRDRHPEVAATAEVVGERPVPALSGLAEHAALLVVGSRSGSRTPNIRVGSVCRGVVHDLARPTAIIPTT